MKKTDEVYLEDVLQAISAIETYVQNSTFDQFTTEKMRHDAVIRQLAIIGEAVNKLSKEFISHHPNFPVRQVVSMRNHLVHGYNEVELAIVWKTVKESLPILKAVVSEAIKT